MGRDVRFRLIFDDSGSIRAVTDNVDGLSSSTKQSVERVDSLAQSLKKLIKFSAGIYTISEAMGQVKNALSSSASFNAKLAEIGTLSMAASTEIERLKRGVIELDFNTSNLDIAQTLYDAQSAGVEFAESLEFVETSSVLARAGLVSISEAGNILTSILNAYSLETSAAMEVSDTLFRTVQLGKTTISELSSALGQIAPTASGMGVALEDVAVALAIMTGKGISTSEAVTQLKALLSNIAAPSAQAAEYAEKIGLQMNFAALEGKGLSGVLLDMIEKTSSSKEAITKLLGSTEAWNAAFALSSENGQALASTLEEFAGKAGAAQAASDRIGATLSEQWGKFQNQLEDVTIQFGDVLEPAAISAMQSIASGAQAAYPYLDEMAAGLAIYTGGRLVAGLAATARGMTALEMAVAATAAKTKILNSALNILNRHPVVLTISALATAGLLTKEVLEGMGESAREVVASTAPLYDATERLIQQNGEYIQQLQKKNDALAIAKQRYEEMGNTVGADIIEKQMQQNSREIEAVTEAVAGLGVAYEKVITPIETAKNTGGDMGDVFRATEEDIQKWTRLIYEADEAAEKWHATMESRAVSLYTDTFLSSTQQQLHSLSLSLNELLDAGKIDGTEAERIWDRTLENIQRATESSTQKTAEEVERTWNDTAGNIHLFFGTTWADVSTDLETALYQSGGNIESFFSDLGENIADRFKMSVSQALTDILVGSSRTGDYGLLGSLVLELGSAATASSTAGTSGSADSTGSSALNTVSSGVSLYTLATGSSAFLSEASFGWSAAQAGVTTAELGAMTAGETAGYTAATVAAAAPYIAAAAAALLLADAAGLFSDWKVSETGIYVSEITDVLSSELLAINTNIIEEFEKKTKERLILGSSSQYDYDPISSQMLQVVFDTFDYWNDMLAELNAPIQQMELLFGETYAGLGWDSGQWTAVMNSADRTLTMEQFTEAMVKEFLSNLMGMEREVYETTALELSGLNGNGISGQLASVVATAVSGNQELIDEMYGAWEAFVEDSEDYETVAEAIATEMSGLVAIRESLSPDRLTASTASTYDDALTTVPTLAERYGAIGVTVANFEQMSADALAASPTPETVQNWQELGEALVSAQSAEAAYVEALQTTADTYGMSASDMVQADLELLNGTRTLSEMVLHLADTYGMSTTEAWNLASGLNELSGSSLSAYGSVELLDIYLQKMGGDAAEYTVSGIQEKVNALLSSGTDYVSAVDIVTQGLVDATDMAADQADIIVAGVLSIQNAVEGFSASVEALQVEGFSASVAALQSDFVSTWQAEIAGETRYSGKGWSFTSTDIENRLTATGGTLQGVYDYVTSEAFYGGLQNVGVSTEEMIAAASAAMSAAQSILTAQSTASTTTSSSSTNSSGTTYESEPTTYTYQLEEYFPGYDSVQAAFQQLGYTISDVSQMAAGDIQFLLQNFQGLSTTDSDAYQANLDAIQTVTAAWSDHAATLEAQADEEAAARDQVIAGLETFYDGLTTTIRNAKFDLYVAGNNPEYAGSVISAGEITAALSTVSDSASANDALSLIQTQYQQQTALVEAEISLLEEEATALVNLNSTIEGLNDSIEGLREYGRSLSYSDLSSGSLTERASSAESAYHETLGGLLSALDAGDTEGLSTRLQNTESTASAYLELARQTMTYEEYQSVFSDVQASLTGLADIPLQQETSESILAQQQTTLEEIKKNYIAQMETLQQTVSAATLDQTSAIDDSTETVVLSIAELRSVAENSDDQLTDLLSEMSRSADTQQAANNYLATIAGNSGVSSSQSPSIGYIYAGSATSGEPVYSAKFFADGGLVRGGRGGVMGLIGEKSYDELVTPLDGRYNIDNTRLEGLVYALVQINEGMYLKVKQMQDDIERMRHEMLDAGLLDQIEENTRPAA